ncbi:MAG: TolC family protein [Planctomycetales bacterium]
MFLTQMGFFPNRWSLPTLLCLAAGGCASPQSRALLDQVGQGVRQPAAVAATATAVQKGPGREGPASEIRPVAAVGETGDDAPPRRSTPGGSKLSERLKIPQSLPGADAPPLALPIDSSNPRQREMAIAALFPDLPALHSDVTGPPTADQPRATLSELEQIALNNNPRIVQAAADVEAALGGAIQAGVYPNPTVGYEADTVGSGGTRNYQGMFFEQNIITAGKLELARSIANVDLMNRQLALRKARAELLTVVRNQYFSVLVARENLTYSEALVQFTNEVYRVQVEQLAGGQAAAYEPMQLRALAVTARGAFAQARNRYLSAWKQLAAALGDPNLPAMTLEGEGARVLPPINYEASLDYLLSNHTDVLAARNLEFQGRLQVRLAEVTPIPDVRLYSAVQRDFTTPPVGRTTYNLQVGIPIPIFNQNRGGIQKARGELVRAAEELGKVRLDLSAQLAETFERYESNRILLEYYRDQILPDQARVYRGVYERHQQESAQVGFGDIIVAQQNLLGSITSFIAAMNGQWDAYADLAGLLQLEDIQQLPLADAGQAGAEPAVLGPLDPAVKIEP